MSVVIVGGHDRMVAQYKKICINRNVERDAENHRILSEQGWKVLVIWECQLKKKVANEYLENLYNAITH